MTDLNFLTGAGEMSKAGAGHSIHDRDYPDYALVLLTGGGGYYHDSAGRSPVTAGDVITVFPHMLHGYGPERGQAWAEIWLAFRGPLFAGLEQEGLLDRKRPVMRKVASPIIASSFRRILADYARPAGARPALFAARLHLLIAELDDRHARRAAAPDDPAWIDRACARLEQRLDERMDLAALAAELDLGYSVFRKRFTRALGIAPARYRLVRRVDRAKSLLAEPGATLASVAQRLGYCDVYFFSRQFRQVTGQAPGAWRRLQWGD